MDPLQLILFRLSERWSQSSWLSVSLASFLIPFILNFANSQLHSLFYYIQELLHRRVQKYEYVYVRRSHSRNSLFRYVSVFLNSKAECVGARKHASIEQPREDTVLFGLESGEHVWDTFEGMNVQWKYNKSEEKLDDSDYYTLSVPKQGRHKQAKYLLHISQTVQKLEEDGDRELHTVNSFKEWESYFFRHPSSFESLAMDSELKKMIKTDLDEFVKSKEYYESVGKPWKRGYLLYGPPGTGKSSMIAAIANYLSYDVYDLDLAGVKSNAELRRLLVDTRNKSVIVIEDIDCAFSTTLEARNKVEKAGKGKKARRGGRRDEDQESGEASEGVTLSGMLNFCDGLWCGRGVETRECSFSRRIMLRSWTLRC